MELFDLAGYTALVTGASRGIGAATARILDSCGARVVLCARDLVRLQDLASILGNSPVTLAADLSTPDGPERLLDAVAASAGPVDILVNNAGTHAPAIATELPIESWDEVQVTNLRSAFLLARGIAPSMAERGWGKIINVSSILGIVGTSAAAAYVTSKTGLLGLTRALAAEWTISGIGVNALCPGWIDTEMVADLKKVDAFDRKVRSRTPKGRWGTVDDLAGSLIFLASHASDFVAGQVLVVDGGLSASW